MCVSACVLVVMLEYTKTISGECEKEASICASGTSKESRGCEARDVHKQMT